MNPNRGENITLPVSGEQQPGSESVNEAKNESLPSAPESSPSKQASAPMLPSIPANIPATQAPIIPTDDDQNDDLTGSQVSNTSTNPDRIEKQWIDRAKAIVAQTKDDPYTQKTEMGKIRADYIKTRFNKVLKTESEK